MMVLEKVNRQVNEGKRMKHGAKPNRYLFFCLHSLAINGGGRVPYAVQA
jgi:hypothetical protein